ncbi:MAG TPA: hypothetical protein RMH99_04590, partial [Sandaracinaceae bacterium LLY-WYZ-13_1]|nr:hypothetical protein [Sandaracinaceae bacterium LLY-WYZ-13_1]
MDLRAVRLGLVECPREDPAREHRRAPAGLLRIVDAPGAADEPPRRGAGQHELVAGWASVRG